MRTEHVRVVGVEHRRLDRGAEQRLGVVHQIGVDRLVAGDQDADRVASGASRPPELLLERRPCPRKADRDHGVQAGDVDAQLQRVGARQAQQVTAAQALLELASFLGQVAAPVGGDPLDQGGVDLGQPPLGRRGHRLGTAARPHERQRPHLADDQVGQQLAGLRGGRPPDDAGRIGVHPGNDGRLPQRDRAGGMRRGVLGDRHDVQAGQPRREDLRIGHGGRGEDEHRVGTVEGADPPQPAQDVGDVGAEHPAIVVALVDHDVGQPAERAGPPGVSRQDRVVQRVGVGQQIVRVVTGPGPLLAGVVAIDRRRPGEGRCPREPAQLVGRQRLGRGEVEHRRTPVAPQRAAGASRRQRGERRRLERQRLSRCGAGRDDGVSPLPDVVQRLGLVPPQGGDAVGGIHGAHLGVDPRRPGLHHGLACGDALDMRHPFAVAQHKIGGVHPLSLPEPPSAGAEHRRCSAGRLRSWLNAPNTGQ